jgi:hypothetical protein
MEAGRKKLSLSKETLRTLNDDELTEVVGGATGICVDSVACHSGVCGSVACNSVVCNSGALCGSAVCNSVIC